MTEERSKLAMVFPGQGSQSVGMLAALAEAEPSVEETFASASSVLGYDLWAVARDGPESELNRTQVTQPAMLAAGVAVWRVWQRHGGPTPAVMAGHSLGEYTALVCAGALELEIAVDLVAQRGAFMQEAVPEGEGAMAAILGLDDGAVEALCARAADDEVVAPANYNAPGQVVVAGQEAAVERVLTLAREAGAKRVVPLPVSVPSHCALMQPAAGRMAEILEEVRLRAPAIPVVHNADAREHADPEGVRAALTRQLDHPVRWVEVVRAMRRRGAGRMVEAGPGKVLVGLVKRIDRDLLGLPVFDPATLEQALGQMQQKG
ncbi:MAG: ACP S-malonyltransferase [Gammaproteobacteria bacterium]|nr:ACP S-malonyltransferase [Gammaproteobacteria bacterium]